MQEHYEKVIAETSRLISDAIISGEDGLREQATCLDIGVKGLLRQVGLGVMERVYGHLAEVVAQEAEDAGIRVNRRSRARFSVVFGEISVASPYHWDPVTRQSARPVQDELGLNSRGRSLGVERALTDFGAEESFAQAAKRFQEHYGWEVGRTTVLRVVEQRATEAEQYVEQRLLEAEKRYEEPTATRPGVARLLLEMDGCELRTGKLVRAPGRKRTKVRKLPRRRRVEAWRDTRVGLAGPVDAPEQRTYVARADSYPNVVRQLFAASCDQGLSSKTQVAAVADGGNGLREELDAQFSNLRFILDRPHLEQHFYQTADAQGLTGEPRE